MPFRAYDPEGVKILSAALKEAKAEFAQTAPFLSPTQWEGVSLEMVRRLMKAYDNGERNPDELRKAALSPRLS